MNINKLLIAGIAGTAAMTLFSGLLGKKENEKFNEPKILAQLHGRLFYRNNSNQKDIITGYILHYLVGIIFTWFFIKYYNYTSKNNLYSKEIILGILAGLKGILIWQFTLKMHNNPPSIPLKKYYFHLILAHIILSVTSVEVYRKIE